jgi:signal transduction histidine kinase
MTGILGIAEMLEYGIYGQLTEQQQEAIGLVIQSTQQLIRLVNDLLQQARIERGSFRLDIIEYSVEDLIAQLRSNFARPIDAKGLKFVIEIAPDLPSKLQGDPLRVFQILSNLVDNAIKFTRVGQIKVYIYTRANADLILEVADSGIGISEDFKKVIFEPFQQGDSSLSRESGGFGLGLSIVKQIVDLIGGSISIESEEGQGSVFTVVLPLDPVMKEIS